MDKGKVNAFRMPTKYAKELKRIGFDVLTVASKHSMDYGEEGKTSTIKTLQEADIDFAGFNDGYEYATIERNGMKIAICAFSHISASPSINDIPKAVELVKKLKATHNLVIVSFTGGAEGVQFSHVPFKKERFNREKRGDVCKFARACVDAGADLVFGHGPQIPRAMELYKNRLIAYSLGCFCTPYKMNLKKTLGYAPLLKIELDKGGNFLSGKIYSFLQKRSLGLVNDEENKVVKEMTRLTKSDFPKTSLVIQKEGWLSKIEMTKENEKSLSSNNITTIIKNDKEYNPIEYLISYARSLLGSRYGRGRSGAGAYDCSGFTRAVYAQLGYKLNPSSRAQYTQGRPIDTANLRPGDLVFWRSPRSGRSIGHVGMVIEANGSKGFRFIHAATRSRGVVIDSYPDRYYYSSRYVGARRILP
jgi:cell wall-associated NlpC family hydrolase